MAYRAPLLFLACFFAGRGSAFAQDLSKHRIQCQSAQNMIVIADRDRSILLLDKAIVAVRGAGVTDIARYTKWFGAPSSSRIAGVLAALQRARTVQVFTQIWCPNSSDATFAPSPTENGRVYPNFPQDIFVGPNFFNLPVSGLGSQAGTIVHEWMHLAGVGLTGNETYSVEGALSLAKSDSGRARDNANNYRYFAEDVP